MALDGEAQTPRALYDAFARRWPSDKDRTALVAGTDTVSFAVLQHRVAILAEQVAGAAGASPTRVLVQAQTPLEVVIALFAAWRANCAAILARPNLTDAQIADVSERLRPTAVIENGSVLRRDGGGWPDQDPSEAVVLTTSGTTGTPKLIALGAVGLERNCEAIAADLNLDADDRNLCVIPLFYTYGLAGVLLSGLWRGGAVHLFGEGALPSTIQRHIRAERITVAQAPPSVHRLHWRFWSGEPFPSVRLVTQGGELCEGDLANWLADAYPQARRVQIFGQTEASPRISHIDMDDPLWRRGCFGPALPHVRHEIEPPQDGGAGPGRLLLKGPGIFLGYLHLGETYAGKDADGVFRTNDLVAVDADGRLFWRGRADRSFKSGGHLIHPEAVERALTAIPGIEEALCAPEPHPVLGMAPMAQVVLQPDAALTEAGIIDACAETLAPFQRPRGVRFVDGFATGGSGKRQLG